MNNFKKHVAEIYSHVKSAEAKWPAGIRYVNDSSYLAEPSRVLSDLDKAREKSKAEQPSECSFRATIAEEILEACVAANEGRWKLCYQELADTAAVVIRAMELIYDRIREDEENGK